MIAAAGIRAVRRDGGQPRAPSVLKRLVLMCATCCGACRRRLHSDCVMLLLGGLTTAL
jgi:hypothetical protein